MQGDVGPPLFAISLISGWEIDDLDIPIRQRLCEALYTLGRTMDAGGSLLEMVATSDEKLYKTVLITKWVSDEFCALPLVSRTFRILSADFTQQCLSTLKNAGLAASDASQHGDLPMLHANINLQTPHSALKIPGKGNIGEYHLDLRPTWLCVNVLKRSST
ncbi:hypothetical protein EV363DRAFT_448595 [Boletus edulis]|nr:hypothetical protein EV363DRAFT_448595 [Boletus edulis]